MELRAVEYVCAVADNGSFTKAASALQIAQPSLSEGVRRLERELGVQLFDRVGRGVRLSPAGNALLGPARQLLRDRDAVLAAVASVRELRGGTLDLVALPTLAPEPLAGLIGRFRAAHPGVSVRLADPADSQALEALVADGRCEVGFSELPPRTDGFVVIGLGRQEIVAVCPPGFTGAHHGRLPVAQLARLPLVTTPAGTSTRDLLERALASSRVQPNIAVETSQREAIAPLVLDGAGVGLLPRAWADELATRGAVIARVVPTLSRAIGLVHRDQPLSPAARAFVELARQPR
jgi:LysR family transcriptional regulator, carnitine catabolism transcriptional activator